ncbi:hypothetical protein [Gorillibacterium sp. sgz5001074]|uniref:hypothetical protein n=1 Tax=Gorillibacterium sp. sgz5001074 TaxID=3446695 RepID=UPI003F664229
MYQNPYFLEKSMEQHNKSVEREARKGWWNGSRQTNEKKQQEPKKAPAAHSNPVCTGKDHNVCCQAFAPCQA